MNLKLIFGLVFIHLIGITGFAQSKKSILKNKIKSITENLTVYENGKEIAYKDSYTLFNKEGEILVETNYNKDGSIKKQSTYQYARGKNKTEETSFHQAEESQKKEVENKKTIYKYNSENDRTEEVEYDGKGNITKKVVYVYNNLGEKTSEMHYDGDGKLRKKILYTYDGKSLRTNRTSYLADNTVESVRKYTYEFY